MSARLQWKLAGHDKVLESLNDDIDSDNLAHANLFAGPEHIGKFTAAKKLARFLQCPDGGCKTCYICREIEKGIHADTIEVPNTGESIKIELVRSLIDKIHMTRREKYKILLIQNIERMTDESSNALLKTLEDPPDGVLFLLSTSRVLDVLPTIISRVRVYKFAKLSEREVMELMRANYPLADEKIIEMVINLAGGLPGRALQLMEDPDLYSVYRKMYEDIEALVTAPDRVNQSAYAGELAGQAKENKNPQLISDFLDIFQIVLRKNMVMNIAGGGGILPQEKVLEMLDKIDKIREYSGRNVNTRMLLENLMFSL